MKFGVFGRVWRIWRILHMLSVVSLKRSPQMFFSRLDHRSIGPPRVLTPPRPCFRIGGAEDNFIFYIEYRSSDEIKVRVQYFEAISIHFMSNV